MVTGSRRLLKFAGMYIVRQDMLALKMRDHLHT